MSTLKTAEAIKSLLLPIGFLLIFVPCWVMSKTMAQADNTLATIQFQALHQCVKKFEYDIHFLGKHVGYLHRTIDWNTKMDAIQAVVNSYGEVSFLWVDSSYQQTSVMQYSQTLNHFLTASFTQKLTGIKSREMDAVISQDGLKSRVTLNDEIHHYQSDQQPLYDLDTLGAQIRLNLIKEKKSFTLLRQASSKIKRYQFQVAGFEELQHEKWGQVKTIKVIEVGEYSETVLWFSIQHDYQLIKAELDMIFSPHIWLSSFSVQCH